MELYLIIYNIKYKKQFRKDFESEYEMDKFINKLKYNINLIILKDSREKYFLE